MDPLNMEILSMDVHVKEGRIISNNRKKRVEYEVNCRVHFRLYDLRDQIQTIEWSVWRSYDEFLVLDEKLRSPLCHISRPMHTISSPPSHSFSSLMGKETNLKFMEKRRSELECYLRMIVSLPNVLDFGKESNGCTDWSRFCGLDQHLNFPLTSSITSSNLSDIQKENDIEEEDSPEMEMSNTNQKEIEESVDHHTYHHQQHHHDEKENIVEENSSSKIQEMNEQMVLTILDLISQNDANKKKQFKKYTRLFGQEKITSYEFVNLIYQLFTSSIHSNQSIDEIENEKENVQFILLALIRALPTTFQRENLRQGIRDYESSTHFHERNISSSNYPLNEKIENYDHDKEEKKLRKKKKKSRKHLNSTTSISSLSIEETNRKSFINKSNSNSKNQLDDDRSNIYIHESIKTRPISRETLDPSKNRPMSARSIASSRSSTGTTDVMKEIIISPRSLSNDSITSISIEETTPRKKKHQAKSHPSKQFPSSSSIESIDSTISTKKHRSKSKSKSKSRPFSTTSTEYSVESDWNNELQEKMEKDRIEVENNIENDEEKERQLRVKRLMYRLQGQGAVQLMPTG